MQAFINYEQKDQAKLLLMAKFAYNNARNMITRQIPFELNFSFYAKVSYEKDVNFWSKFQAANKFTKELQQLAIICRENLQLV